MEISRKQLLRAFQQASVMLSPEEFEVEEGLDEKSEDKRIAVIQLEAD